MTLFQEVTKKEEGKQSVKTKNLPVESLNAGPRASSPYTLPVELNMKEVKSGNVMITSQTNYPPKCTALELSLEAGNVPWKWKLTQGSDQRLTCNLQCLTATKSNLWKITAHISVVFKENMEDGINTQTARPEKLLRDQIFDEKNTKLDFFFEKDEWEGLAPPLLDGTTQKSASVAVDVEINVKYIAGFKTKRRITFDLSNPTTESDVVFKFDEKLVYLNISYLAMHSEYFAILHSRLSEMETKNNIGLPIQNMEEEFDEFHELMEVVYPSKKEITDKNVEYILKLADRFTLDGTIADCENFLISKSKEIDIFTKLHWSSKYCLTELQDDCLSKLTTFESITAVLQSPMHSSLSLEVMNSLFKLLSQSRKVCRSCGKNA